MGIIIRRSDGLRIRVTGTGVDGDPIGEVIDDQDSIVTVRRLNLAERDAYYRAQKSGKIEVAVIKHHNGVIKTQRYWSPSSGKRSVAPQRSSLRSNKSSTTYRVVEIESQFSVRIGTKHLDFPKGLY